MIRVCAICMQPVEFPVPIVLDGVEFVAHGRCKQGMEEEMENVSKKVVRITQAIVRER